MSHAEQHEQLFARLSSPEAEERRQAVRDFPDLFEAEPLRKLVKVLGDEDWRVRKEAIGRIVRWGDVRAVVAELVAVLRDEDDVGWRNASVEALTRLAGASVGPLVEDLRRGGEHLKFVIDTLGAIGDERAVPTLIETLDAADLNLRVASAEALGGIGGESAKQALILRLECDDTYLRMAVFDALCRLRAQVPVVKLSGALEQVVLAKSALSLLGWTESPAALAPLRKALRGSQPRIHGACAISIFHLMESLTGDADEQARKELSELAPAARQNLRSLLQTCLESESDSMDDSDAIEAARAVARILGAAGDLDAVPMLASGLLDASLAEACDTALNEIGPAGFARLIDVIHHADEEMRGELFCWFGELEAGSEDLDTILIAGLKDPSEDCAAAAARALGRVGGVAAGPALGAAVSAEDAPELAAAAAASLGRMSKRGLDVAARKFLEGGLESTAPEIRSASALALGSLGDPGVCTALGRHLTDEDPYARLAAIRALASIGMEGQALLSERLDQETDSEMVDALREALTESAGGGSPGQ